MRSGALHTNADHHAQTTTSAPSFPPLHGRAAREQHHTMMDTTNSFANSGVSLKCKPRLLFKVSGSSSSMSGVKKSTKGTKTAPESDGSSNSEDSNTSESENGMKALPRTSNHSLRSSQHSLRSSPTHSQSRKRSNLKKAVRTPAPEADSFDLSDSEEYGDIMKDYCYNENNVLVPRIKLGTSVHSTNNNECDDDELSVGSSHSARERLRRGGRRPGKSRNGADEGSENTLDSSSSSKKKAQRRKGNFSFWDQDTDSSESENEVLGLSPSKGDARNSVAKSSSSPPQHRFSMIAARKKDSAGNVSRENSAGSMSRESSSVGSSDYFTAQEGPPSPRRGVARNDSGWHTGGSFDSDDEDFVKGPPTRTNNFSKLSQAALRMSRTESSGAGSTSSAFSFTKTNGKMENFSAIPAVYDSDDPEEEDDSNHSSASKTTSSFVSAGGWSTGKDSSSSEDEGGRRRPVATKKSASKTSKKDTKNKNKTPPVETSDPFAEFDNPKNGSRSMKVSAHSTESKFSFISAGNDNSSFSAEDSGVSPISCSISSRRNSVNDFKDTSESSKLEAFEEENNGSFVFDLSGMKLDSNAMFTDDPPTVSNHDGEGVEALLSTSAHVKPATAVTPGDDEKARRKAAKKAKKESSKKSGEGKKDKSRDHKKEKTDKEKSKSSGKHKKDKLKDSELAKDKEKSKHQSKNGKLKDSSGHAADKPIKSKKKKSSDETSVSVESKKEEKKKDSTAMTADEEFLEKRRTERAARLEKAKERIKQQEADKKEEEETKKKMKALERKRTVVSTGSEFDRRERAYQWYTRCGMPTKEKLKERLRRVQECDVSDEDLDLLPWMTGDRMVNVAKMMKILRER